MLILAWLLGITAVGTALIWIGSDWLEEASDRLAAYYGLPAIVQGAIIAAAGSSFPELASVVLSTLRHGAFELGIATVVGSALFNILVIPGVVALVQSSPLEASPMLVYKDAQFYLVSLLALLVVFSLAVIYYPTGSTALSGRLTPGLAAALLALYILYVLLQYLETIEYDAASPPAMNVLSQWGRLAAGLVLIFLGVEGLIYATLELGAYFDTSAFLWGVIIIAAGTSLPDAFISLKAARNNQDAVSLANVFGSNIFDLLVVLPVGIFLGGAVAVDLNATIVMMAVLVVATIFVLTAARTDFEITDVEAYGMLVFYGGFVVWILLESIGITNLVG